MLRPDSSAERFAPWAVLAVFLLLTLLATQYVWDSSRLADRVRYENAVTAARDAIQFRVDMYANVLAAAAGVFAATDVVDRREFRAYVRHLNIQQRYPGIQGIGLSVRTTPELAPQLEAVMRDEGFTDFRIWPPGQRDEYHAIVHLEPLDRRNRAAVGFDMFTDPVRRMAMVRARDSGMPAASGRVMLVQEIDIGKQPGFLIYAPVYAARATPSTPDERRAALYGYVYAPFRAYDLLGAIFAGQRRREIGFEVYDGSEASPAALLFATEVLPSGLRPRFTSTSQVSVAGRVWTIRFFSRRYGLGAPFRLALFTAIGGLLVSGLLFALIRVQSRARSHAERTAERLRMSEAELQDANRTKDEFLATLSHELRTPMTAILGWSKMLAGEELDPETYATAVDAIQKSSRAQAQLIDDLLDVSRITAGKMRIDAQPTQLAPIVQAATEPVAPAAEAKGVRLETRFGGAPIHVSGDAQRLQQVIWNLLSNAVKFTPRGGTVTVSLRADAHDAIIEVRDTGQGIDPEFLPYVFERFRQADSSSSRAYTGLGLGLAIVRHLVELHGGNVEASSGGIERGSTFTVRLPLLRTRSAAGEEDASEDDEITGVLRGAHVLVVDDEEEVRTYLGTVLRRAGAEVRFASSAAEALRALEDAPADVVLSDLGMPEVDGYELLTRIHAARPALPVVALTAYARPEDRQRALRAGFHSFVTKPIEPVTLRAAVGEALAAASTR